MFDESKALQALEVLIKRNSGVNSFHYIEFSNWKLQLLKLQSKANSPLGLSPQDDYELRRAYDGLNRLSLIIANISFIELGTAPTVNQTALDSFEMSKTNDSEGKRMSTSLLNKAEERTKKNRSDLASIINKIFTYNELRRFVDFHLQTDPENISIPDDKSDFIYDMLVYFQKRRQLNEVVMGVRQWRPNDPDLYAYSMKVGLAAEIIAPGVVNFDLEAIINEETGIPNLRQWRLKLAAIENQVCLIKIRTDDNSQAIPNGTGFLVGNDFVLTNWHVVNHFIDTNGNAKKIKADTITAHFGFFAELDTDELDTDKKKAGKEYLLDASSWLVAHSPQSELDYALLKLEKNAAEEAAGGEDNYMDRHQDNGMVKRGYIAIPEEIYLRENMPLFILQHPGGEPMGIAVDFVSKLDHVNHRIQYKANTRKGSSGSPCFDAKWNLVALHHASIEGLEGKSNEGVPITKIYESLKSKNIDL